ncbi:IMP dehydrogenase [Bacillus cereus]
MENVFDYEDIQLIPAKCIVNSRSECDTTVTLGKHKFKLPVVPANMQTIIDERIATYLAENNYFYIMHRFQPEKRISFIRDMQSRGLIASISVGVKEDEYEFVQQLAAEQLTPEYITIDIAHGHSNAVINMIQHIKKTFTRELRYRRKRWNSRSGKRIRKCLVPMQQKLVLDLVKFVLLKLKQASELVVGS